MNYLLFISEYIFSDDLTSVNKNIMTLLMIFIICLIYRFKDNLINWKYESILIKTYGVLMILNILSYSIRHMIRGTFELTHLITLDMCPLLGYAYAYVCLTNKKHLNKFLFFLAIGSGIASHLFPASLTVGPTDFRFYQFYFLHSGNVILAFYFLFVHKMIPTHKDYEKIVVFILIYSPFTLIYNYIFDTRFFLVRPNDIHFNTPMEIAVNLSKGNVVIYSIIMILVGELLFYVIYKIYYMTYLKNKY